MLDLDVTVLHALVGDEPATVAGLLSSYVSTVTAAASDARCAFETRDAASVERAVHLAKSPSLCVGAVPFGEVCAALEDAARRSDWPRLAALWPTFEPAFSAAMRAARAHIDTLAVAP